MAVSMQSHTNEGIEEKDTGFPLKTAGMTEGSGGKDGGVRREGQRGPAGRTEGPDGMTERDRAGMTEGPGGKDRGARGQDRGPDR